MDINLVAVLVAAVAWFAFGAVWFGPIFSKTWGKIHGFDKLSKERQKELMSKMGPIYAIQFLVTLISVYVVAWLTQMLPDYSAYTLMAWVWLGFVLPTQTSGVLFSNDPEEWKVPKLAIMTFNSLISLFLAVWVLGLF